MTEHGHNFIREIAEAYRALEQEGALQERIRHLEAQHVKDGEHVARLEERMIRRNEEINELHAKVRSVEAERDDAGFRLLESEDRLDAIRKAIGLADIVEKAVAKAEASVRAELTPKEPEKGPELVIVPESATATLSLSEPNVTQTQGQSANPSPSAGIGQASEPSIASTGDVGSQGSASTGDGRESAGESVVDPTGGTGGTTGSGSAEASSTPKLYAGKKYIQVEGYISRSDWVDGGGSNEDYDWRPEYLHRTA